MVGKYICMCVCVFSGADMVVIANMLRANTLCLTKKPTRCFDNENQRVGGCGSTILWCGQLNESCMWIDYGSRNTQKRWHNLNCTISSTYPKTP